MDRIYHHHDKWEEVKYGMYDKYNPKDKEMLIQRVIYFFGSYNLIKENMHFVCQTFRHSCEHNFTNPSMNRIAFLVQAAVAVWSKIPREITMIAWNFLDEKTQDIANNIAREQIKRWEECQKNI